MNKQKGFTLIEVSLVTILFSAMTMLTFAQKNADFQTAKAREVAMTLLEYNNAVRGWLADNEPNSGDEYTDSRWLKSSAGCPPGVGLATKGYLPCDFPEASATNPIRFGSLSLITSVVEDTSYPGKYILATTTSPFRLAGIDRPDLAGLAALTMNSTFSLENSPLLVKTTGSAKSDVASSKITMLVREGEGSDQWLKTDGSNTMQGDITFDDTMSLILKNLSGIESLPGQSFVVDGDTDFRDTLRIFNENAEPYALVIENGNISIKNGEIHGSRFIDTVPDPVDPSSEKDYVIHPSGDSNVNNLHVEGMLTVNELKLLSRITADEYIQVNGHAQKGKPCESNGLVGRSTGGSPLFCTEGEWHKYLEAITQGGTGDKYVAWFMPANGTIIATGYGKVTATNPDLSMVIRVDGAYCSADQFRFASPTPTTGYASVTCIKEIGYGNHFIDYEIVDSANNSLEGYPGFSVERWSHIILW